MQLPTNKGGELDKGKLFKLFDKVFGQSFKSYKSKLRVLASQANLRVEIFAEVGQILEVQKEDVVKCLLQGKMMNLPALS